MAQRGRERAAIFGGFVLLAVCSTWPLMQHPGAVLPSDLGDPLLNAWILGWDADRLRHGLSGLWNAPILYPNTQTLAFSEHLLGIAVPLAPVIWVTGNPVLAYNIAFLLTYVLAATGMFLLARELTGRTDAAVLAALAFAFGPPRTDQISHLQVLASGWMPIALWALHRYFATFSRRWLAAFVAAFSWQALSNGYFLYFLSLPVATVIAFESLAKSTVRERVVKTAVELSIAGAAIVLILSPVIKVYLDVRERYGLRRSYGDLVNFAANVESYLHVAEPVRLWSRWLAVSLAPERQLFPGLLALLLAAVALFPRALLSGLGFSRVAFSQVAFSQVAFSQSGAESQISTQPRPAPYVWCYATIALMAFVLSLGAEPTAWGHRVLPLSPYLMLSSIVPGLDGLRAPARFSVVVTLAASVLAAIGSARLLRSTTWARWIFPCLGLALIAEGWSAPIRLAAFDPHGRPPDRPLYDWLAAQPAGAVLELPVKSWDVAPTLTYQYASLFHRHQIVNGYSGYGSTLQGWLGGSASPLNELGQLDVTIDALRSAGIRYIVVHRDDYPERAFADQTIGRLRALGAQIADVRSFGSTDAFRLSERSKFDAPAIGRSTLVPLSQVRASASHGNDRLYSAFDGDRDSRWFTGRGQGGNEWIRIEFQRPLRIEGIKLLMSERSLGDYPRSLTVDSVDQYGRETTVRSGPVLAQFIRGLLADGDYPWIDIALRPQGLTKSIVLKQLGTTRSWYWSIHEIQVMESLVNGR